MAALRASRTVTYVESGKLVVCQRVVTRHTVCWLSEAYVRILRRALREIEEDTGLDALRMGAKRTRARRETMAWRMMMKGFGCLFRPRPNLPNSDLASFTAHEACCRRHWCIQVSLNLIFSARSHLFRRGIGLAVTRLLLQKFHANVIAISRTRTQELIQLSSDSLMVIECDVLVAVPFHKLCIRLSHYSADDKALASAISEGASHYQGLDGLILNAATLQPSCRITDDTPLDAWKRHFDINFFSLVTATRVALPYLRKSAHGGKIVFVSSGAAVKGIPGWGPYNASKAAMNSLCRYVYACLQSTGLENLCRTLGQEEPDVTSVAVRPGMVDTNVIFFTYI